MNEVRASHLKDDLVTLSGLGAGIEARVRSRLAASTIGAIEQSTRFDWLPVQLNAEMADAVYAEAGPAGARLWGRTSLVRALDTSLLRGLARTTVALFGLSPKGLFKFSPLAWEAIYRDCGELVVQLDGPNKACIRAGPLPTSLANISYTTALAGTFEGAFTFCKVEGNIEMQVDAAADCPGYIATWGP